MRKLTMGNLRVRCHGNGPHGHCHIRKPHQQEGPSTHHTATNKDILIKALKARRLDELTTPILTASDRNRAFAYAAIVLNGRDIVPEEYTDGRVLQTSGYVDERLRNGRNITPPNEPYIRLAERYGDSIALFLEDSKQGAKEQKTEGWQTFQNDGFIWTTMAEKLKEEEPRWSQYYNSFNPTTPIPTNVDNHLAVIIACNALALEFDDVRTIIYGYAERNGLARSPMERFIEERIWGKLACALRKDLDDIPRVVPCRVEWLQKPLAWCLKHYIKTMLKMEEWDSDQTNPESWKPLDYVRELASKHYKKALKEYRGKARSVGNFRQLRKVAKNLDDEVKQKKQKRLLQEAIQHSTKAVDAFSEANGLGVVEDEQIAEIMEIGAELSAEEDVMDEDNVTAGLFDS
ncbi:MAG: hypothetical protein Q9218_001421 [Villophora microphyllina]